MKIDQCNLACGISLDFHNTTLILILQVNKPCCRVVPRKKKRKRKQKRLKKKEEKEKWRYRFNASSIKIPMTFFMEIRQIVQSYGITNNQSNPEKEQSRRHHTS